MNQPFHIWQDLFDAPSHAGPPHPGLSRADRQRRVWPGPGMFHHFDAVMYAGDLHYQIVLEDGSQVNDLAGDQHDNRTHYTDHILPISQTTEEGLEIHLISVAPGEEIDLEYRPPMGG